MDTRPDVFSPDSQRFFDLEAAERLLEEERTQLAAAKLGLHLAMHELISDVSVSKILDAVGTHEKAIEEILAFAATAEEISTPEAS